MVLRSHGIFCGRAEYGIKKIINAEYGIKKIINYATGAGALAREEGLYGLLC